MSKKIKSLLYNFLGFLVFYVPAYILVMKFSSFQGFWIPAIAAVISTILAPKFQAIKGQTGEKIFMKWIFRKGVKEVK